MERRKFMIGMGSMAAGASALVGSGAFSSVEANRNVDIQTMGDGEAYLALSPNDGPNGGYARYSNGDPSTGHLEIDFNGEGNTGAVGDGINMRAVTTAHNVFDIENQGTQDVGVWVEHSGTNVSFYNGDDPSDSIEGSGNAVTLGVGDVLSVGVEIDASSINSVDEIGPTVLDVYADADEA